MCRVRGRAGGIAIDLGPAFDGLFTDVRLTMIERARLDERLKSETNQ